MIYAPGAKNPCTATEENCTFKCGLLSAVHRIQRRQQSQLWAMKSLFKLSLLCLSTLLNLEISAYQMTIIFFCPVVIYALGSVPNIALTAPLRL